MTLCARSSFEQLLSQVKSQIIGQSHVVDALAIGLICNGHVLLEGLPGTAKTRAIKALADSLAASLGRVQFTPDLLPSDITGSERYLEVAGKGTLKFEPGPVFNNLVLADEINRAPAKVQSALLEAMAEGQITVSGETYALPQPFMVLATQNPVEQEGTYPLPEAQMDRFLLKVNVDYPDDQAELGIMRLVRSEEQPDSIPHQPISPQAVLIARQELQSLHVSEAIEHYIVALVMATRKPERYPHSPLGSWLRVGASPRATIALDRASRAHAWLKGRDYVEPDDVRAVVHMVLGHRLLLSFDATADGMGPSQVLDELLNVVALV